MQGHSQVIHADEPETAVQVAIGRKMVDTQPIGEVIAELRKESEESIKQQIEWEKANCEARIAKAIAIRQAVALLHAADLIKTDDFWGQYGKKLRYFRAIDLGSFKNTKMDSIWLAEKLREIRRVLGCRLEMEGKHPYNNDGQTVEFTLKAVEYPGITFKYRRPLPPGARCKLVAEQRIIYNLVCES